MARFKNALKNLLLFNRPEKVEKFVLKEDKNETVNADEEKKVPEKPRNLESIGISKDIKKNLDYVKQAFSIPINSDVILREFEITIKNKIVSAFIVFFDGMVDRNTINSNILSPLMVLSNIEFKGFVQDVESFVKNRLLSQNQLKVVRKMAQVVDEVNLGGCGVFVDGIDVVFALDVKGWEHRNVEKPVTELVIRGPQEAFNEILRVNTALIRKILKDQHLIVEDSVVGEKSKTNCAILYIKDIANDSLVAEVRRRIKSIKVDYLISSGELEQLIEDNSFLPEPQILATERPDRVAELLAEGRVAIILQGNPFVLIVPVTYIDLLHSAEDVNLRLPYVNLIRIIRVVGLLFTLLLPGIYLSIINYHQEMLPTDLLLSIDSAREKVPFPTIVELLILEISFELIREAGIRVPSPIGPTLGIIGALILGQAAVAANIVSPVMIIIVALTGIGSYAVPNYSFAFSNRFLRFGYIGLAAAAGFLGITLGMFMQGMWMVATKSFGVPFLSMFTAKYGETMKNGVIRAPIWQMERRNDYLNPKKTQSQPEISRGWVKEGEQAGGEREGGHEE